MSDFGSGLPAHLRSESVMLEEAHKMAKDKSGKSSFGSDRIIKERKDKIVKFFKERYDWIVYVLLAIVVWISVHIRTRNLPGLRDVTTGGWTLGPDLDPFLFLRWAKYIVENGSIMAVDMMRYSPLGLSTSEEYLLHPYMIAWFHNFASIFGSESVTQSAVIYPVFFFAITVIAFFFLVRKVFVNHLGNNKASIVALVASFFLSVLSALLPRTIAGIPEKESVGFFFLFAALYFFVSAWKAKKNGLKIIFATLSGLATAGMAHVWGGYIFIFYTIGIASFIAFLLGKFEKDKIMIYAFWLITSFIFMVAPGDRHRIAGFVGSTPSAIALFVFFVIIFHFILSNIPKLRKLSFDRFKKTPPPIISVIISIVTLAILSTAIFGISFIPDQVGDVLDILVKPATSRLIQTVAENRQPYFNEWANNFGPQINGIPIIFWMFFIGSIYLFYRGIKIFRKKEKIYLTLSYIFLLSAVIFSRHSQNGLFNGENFISGLFYVGGVIVFTIIFGKYYYNYYKNNELGKFEKIDFGIILIFSFFFLSIVAARAAVRTIMVLVPSAAAIAAYFIVGVADNALKERGKNEEGGKKLAIIGIALIVVFAGIYSGYHNYKGVEGVAHNYVPSQYTIQWQNAMGWVRDNVSEDAVFGHWWDYGYWVQSIGERATVLDGGNSISYWNHMMGRYALTGSDEGEALDFLYAHNTTHFLIDSTDIGKYTAFSSIGSDLNYDRRSWINVFHRDNSRLIEAKNRTIHSYTGGTSLDEDLIYEFENGETIFIPGLNDGAFNGGPGVGGVGILTVDVLENGEILQPKATYVDVNGGQFELPLRYAFHDGEFKDFGSGVEAGIFLFPRFVTENGGGQIENDGVALYLSSRTVKSQLARLYLYGQEENFKLVHQQDDFVVEQIKQQSGIDFGGFIYYQGIRGPIKIWEIQYPLDMEIDEGYIDTIYPEELRVA